MRTFREFIPGESADYRLERTSHLDTLVANSKQLHWASPLFDLDPDGLVRRWRLWEASCNSDGKPSYLPSVQLLSFTIQKTGSAESLNTQLTNALPKDCSDWGNLNNHLALEIDGQLFTTTQNRIQQRIIYNFPWPRVDPQDPPKVDFKRRDQSIKTPVLQWLPAHVITEAQALPESSLVTGRHVIIGASFANSRDIHATPLGFMPGSLILINAIYSLINHGELKPPSFLTLLLIEAFLIILMSILFTLYSPALASYLTIGGIVLVIVPGSLMVFKEGIWLDLAAPLFGVQLHRLIGAAENYWQEKIEKHNNVETL